MTRDPCRIQRRREKGWRMPAGTIYVGRGTAAGNPFRLPPQTFSLDQAAALRAQRAECVSRFVRWLRFESFSGGNEILLAARKRALLRIPLLRGRDLACWCGLCPEHAAGLPLGVHCEHCDPCHADVLLKEANR